MRTARNAGRPRAAFNTRDSATCGTNSTAFYAAAHVRAFAETSWDPGVSVQTGFHVKRDQRSANLRLGLEGYVGRAILGEFALDYDEAYLTAGIFFDFY
jgi:hypothetical protein